MKYTGIIFAAILGIALLTGCAANNATDAGGTPMDIKAFSFHHTASNAEECFRFELSSEENGVRLYAEELFINGRVAVATLESSQLDHLCELVGELNITKWDGFDKASKRGSDGSAFTLNITLTDGSTVSAHGSNRFPDNYSELYSAVREMYKELMELHGIYTEGADAP